MFRVVTQRCLQRLNLVKSSRIEFTHRSNFLKISSYNQLAFVRNESSVSGANNAHINQAASFDISDTPVPISAQIHETHATSNETLSTTTANETTAPFDISDIPEPPSLPVDDPLTTLEILRSDTQHLIELVEHGEVPLSSVGLGGYWPSGWVQNCLNYLHCDFGLPWWAAILTGTIVIRLVMFPLVIKSQRTAARMRNNMPQLQRIQLKMTEARQSGNAYESAKCANDMLMFMKEKDISPMKQMMVPFAMAPIFMSFFFGLRGMANLPLPSLQTGGLFWFTDLTICDPYYILPLICSTTLFLIIETGADGAAMTTQGPMLKYIMRGIPLVVFPFVMHFPAALLCYWVSTNAISLVQVSILKIPAVRAKFNIDKLLIHPKESLPIENKGFVKSAKDSWTNLKISRQMEERERHDEIVFKRAGITPIPKTYKYDPTKVQPPAIEAKRK